MNKEFKQWLKANKLPIIRGRGKKSEKYSILPIVRTTIYDPNTFEPVCVYRMITKERYDELIKTGDLIYGEGRLLKF